MRSHLERAESISTIIIWRIQSIGHAKFRWRFVFPARALCKQPSFTLATPPPHQYIANWLRLWHAEAIYSLSFTVARDSIWENDKKKRIRAVYMRYNILLFGNRPLCWLSYRNNSFVFHAKEGKFFVYAIVLKQPYMIDNKYKCVQPL